MTNHILVEMAMTGVLHVAVEGLIIADQNYSGLSYSYLHAA